MGLLEILGIKRHGAEAHNATGVTPGTYSAPMTLEINEAGHVTAAYDVWQESVTYGNNDLVVASDSFLYKSQLAGNVGNDPSVDDGTNWKFLGHELLPRDGTRAMEADLDAGSHKVVNLNPPTQGTDAANKDYVDSVAAGLGGGVSSWKQPARVATVSALASNSRSGNVLTASSNGALSAIDGVTLALNDRVLVKNEATGANNGLYFVSALGSAGAPWTLTRTTDADASAEVVTGIACLVQEGTVNASRQFILTTTGAITLNTTALTFTQFGSGSGVPAGTGSGNTLRWNGSSWAESSLLKNDGSTVTVTPAASNRGVSIVAQTGLSTIFPLYVENDVVSNIVNIGKVAPGAFSGGQFIGGVYAYPTASGHRAGSIGFGTMGSGSSFLGSGLIDYISTEPWSGSARGGYWRIIGTLTGTTTAQEAARFYGDGDVILRSINTRLSTSTTIGFTHLPDCQGAPTGTPAITRLGAVPFIFDSSNNKLYAYNSGWQDLTPSGEIAGGKFVRNSTEVSNTYSVQATDFFLHCDAANTYSVTLPAANAQEGRLLVIKRNSETGQVGSVSISRAGSDTIANHSTPGLTSLTLAAGDCYTLISDGVSKWHVVAKVTS